MVNTHTVCFCYAGALQDIREGFRILKPGGYLVGHDCVPDHLQHYHEGTVLVLPCVLLGTNELWCPLYKQSITHTSQFCCFCACLHLFSYLSLAFYSSFLKISIILCYMYAIYMYLYTHKIRYGAERRGARSATVQARDWISPVRVRYRRHEL